MKNRDLGQELIDSLREISSPFPMASLSWLVLWW